MSTDPRPRVPEPGEFDFYAARPPIFEGLTDEERCHMPPAEKIRRVNIAWVQVREIHREWYRERNPGANDVEVWGDWLRVTECAPILAKAARDAAERDTDPPFVVFAGGGAGR